MQKQRKTRSAATRFCLRAVAAGGVLLAAVIWAAPSRAVDQDAIAVAVADFDYTDTSGEVANQTAQHEERVKSFGKLLRSEFAAHGKYKVVKLDCGKPDCSTSSLGADDLIAAARRSGARLLIYGGIHKMSTLIQWGQIQVVDLQQKQLLLDRRFTFRGDTDLAFDQAASFVGGLLAGITPKS